MKYFFEILYMRLFSNTGMKFLFVIMYHFFNLPARSFANLSSSLYGYERGIKKKWNLISSDLKSS